MIMITSSAKIDAQIWVGDASSSVELSLSGVIKDKVTTTGIVKKQYTFYAISTFNVTLNLLYGQVEVTIVDPS